MNCNTYQLKHMLREVKRNLSMRQFFGAPNKFFKQNTKKKHVQLYTKTLCFVKPQV